jgi:hypothetical protein
VKTVDLDPNRSYLFGSHPHGLLCAGAFCAFATDALNFTELFPGKCLLNNSKILLQIKSKKTKKYYFANKKGFSYGYQYFSAEQRNKGSIVIPQMGFNGIFKKILKFF